MTFWKTLLASSMGFFLSMLVIGIMSIIFFAAIISAGVSSTESVKKSRATKQGTVLSVRLSGSIPEYSNGGLSMFTRGGSGKTIREYLASLDAVKSDKKMAGVFIRLSGYTGSWSQADELREKLAELKSAGKFVYATSDAEGCNEKEYLIASVADTIIMNPAATLEMNGIAAQLIFFKPAMDKFGVQADVVKVGKYKSAVEPYILDSASAENREMVTGILTEIFDHFKNTVTVSRRLSPGALDSILDNKLLLRASEAREAGLIDMVLYDDQIDSLMKARTGVKTDKNLARIEIDDYDGQDTGPESGDDHASNQIAIVYATGEIRSGSSGFDANPLFGGSETLGSQTFGEAMKDARQDEDIKAVVLRINSPGGSAVASQEMWREIRLTAAKKPVVVSMGGLAASGGYFMAAGGDHIFAEPATLTGSIGVFGLMLNMEKLFKDKIGLNVQTITTNPSAGMMSATHAKSEHEKQVLQNSVDSVYQTFLSIVAKGRGITVDSVNQIAQGRVWTGMQALKNGLVDEIGGLDTAIRYAAGKARLKEYSIRILPRRKEFFEAISEIFRSSQSALATMQSPVSQYRQFADALNARAGVQALAIGLDIR